jgi:hypothetical protein
MRAPFFIGYSICVRKGKLCESRVRPHHPNGGVVNPLERGPGGIPQTKRRSVHCCTLRLSHLLLLTSSTARGRVRS